MYDSLSDLINVFAKLLIDQVIYEAYFQTLCYDTNDLLVVYWTLFVVPLFALIFFYKVWDPVENGKQKLALTFLISLLVVVGVTYFELFNNSAIITEIEAFNEDDQIANPYFFVFPYGLVTGLFSSLICFIWASLTRFISTNNNSIPRILFKK